MDFAKFVALLETSSIHFARIDKLGDPFEGSLSKLEFEKLKVVAAKGEAENSIPAEWKGRYLEVLLLNARRSRRAMYVNCWHRSNDESEAMWQLYAPSGIGVAIQSTYAKLVDVLPKEVHDGCFVGAVQYIDHHKDEMPEGNMFYAALHKRRAFEHEKELRALVGIADPGYWIDPEQSGNPTGINVPVALIDLVAEIFVSPAAPPWFLNTVRGVLDHYGLSVQVRQSELSLPAYY